MTRHLLRSRALWTGIVLLAGWASLGSQPPTGEAAPRAIDFQLVLPADAQVTVEGFRTNSSGENRLFRTPPVAAGARYTYQVAVTWQGQTLRRAVVLSHDRANLFDWRADLAALAAPPARGERPLEFHVILPADAQLRIEDRLTESTGGTRHFQTPPVAIGPSYAYTMTLAWQGKTLRKLVSLAHDRENVFDWRKDLEALASASPSAEPLPPPHTNPPARPAPEAPRVGTVVLDAGEPGIPVVVEQGGKPVGTLQAGRTRQLDLPPGDYTLKLGAGQGEYLLSTEGFRLEAGEKLLLTLRRQPKPPAPPAPMTGTLAIDAPNPNVTVVVEQSGKLVALLYAGTKSQAELPPGTYTLKLGEGTKDLALGVDQVKLEAGARTIVAVRPAARPPVVKADPPPVRPMVEPMPPVKPEPPKPALTLTAPPRLKLKPGETQALKITTRRENFQGPVQVQLPKDLPAGVKASITATEDEAITIEFSAAKNAAAGTFPLTLEGSGGGKTVKFVVALTVEQAAPATVRLRLPEKGIELHAGEKGTFRVQVERTNVEGELAVKFERLPRSVKVKPDPIAAGADSTLIEVEAARDAKPGKELLPVRVTTGPDGEAIVGSEMLALTILPPRTVKLVVDTKPLVIQAGADREATIRIQVKRGGFSGPVVIRFSNLPEGVTIKEVTLPADKEEETVPVAVRADAAAAARTVTITAEFEEAHDRFDLPVTIAAKTPMKPAEPVKPATPQSPEPVAAKVIKLTVVPEVVRLTPGKESDVTVTVEVPAGQGRARLKVEGLPDKTYWYLKTAPTRIPNSSAYQETLRFGAAPDAAAVAPKDVKVRATPTDGGAATEQGFKVQVERK
jgi:uncharacterized protein (TIGR03000 family)